MPNKEPGLENINERLDQIIALLRVLAKKNLNETKKSVLSTSRKEQIYNLCDGESDIQGLSRTVGVSREYVRITLKELEDSGLILIKQRQGRAFPKRIL